ncbi:MAG: hypothetical protein LBV12_02245 [Puniceicoccales bacterium]|jgi:hypothetical protein|nr:hypothetical protein [Puniceicoccales bacterium]
MIRSILFFCLFACTPLWANKTGITIDPQAPKEWPRSTRVEPGFEVKVIKEDAATNTYVYQTPHFEFHSDAKLMVSLVRDFSLIFESTLLAVKNNPLGLNPRMGEPRYQVKLFKNREDYLADGGMKGSAGIYMGSRKQILVPLESLNVRIQGKSATRGKGGDNDTLVHEITHQVMHDWLRYLPMWCVEGMAEYMRAIPYRNGIFNCSRISPKEYAQNLKSFVPLSKLMRISNQEWSEAVADSTGHDNYLSTGLLCYYFIHLDGKGDGARFKAFLKKLSETGNYDEAEKVLLDNRTLAQVEDELKNAFKKKERMELGGTKSGQPRKP